MEVITCEWLILKIRPTVSKWSCEYKLNKDYNCVYNVHSHDHCCLLTALMSPLRSIQSALTFFLTLLQLDSFCFRSTQWKGQKSNVCIIEVWDVHWCSPLLFISIDREAPAVRKKKKGNRRESEFTPSFPANLIFQCPTY